MNGVLPCLMEILKKDYDDIEFCFLKKYTSNFDSMIESFIVLHRIMNLTDSEKIELHILYEEISDAEFTSIETVKEKL